MNVTLVEINIKPERVDEFLEVFRANHEGAIQEPGNLRFDVLQDPRVKTRFFIYEAYKDEEAVLAHKQTPHYLACVDKLEELMSEPRKNAALSGYCRSNGLARWRCAYRAFGEKVEWFCRPDERSPPGFRFCFTALFWLRPASLSFLRGRLLALA